MATNARCADRGSLCVPPTPSTRTACTSGGATPVISVGARPNRSGIPGSSMKLTAPARGAETSQLVSASARSCATSPNVTQVSRGRPGGGRIATTRQAGRPFGAGLSARSSTHPGPRTLTNRGLTGRPIDTIAAWRGGDGSGCSESPPHPSATTAATSTNAHACFTTLDCHILKGYCASAKPAAGSALRAARLRPDAEHAAVAVDHVDVAAVVLAERDGPAELLHDVVAAGTGGAEDRGSQHALAVVGVQITAIQPAQAAIADDVATHHRAVAVAVGVFDDRRHVALGGRAREERVTALEVGIAEV